MNIFRILFSSNKVSRENSDIENLEIFSIEHIKFANTAIEVFSPVMKQFEFKLLKFKITEFNTSIIWIRDKCYIDLGGTTHPHDAPIYYGIALGEFRDESCNFSEINCVGLWRMKAIHDNLDKVEDTPFPFGDNILPSLNKTKDDLIKYGKGFLEGHLTRFYYARNIQRNQ